MAFTILANSTTADATEVMGNFYYVGAGNNLPYFQTTAGNLSAVDNTYDLGADTTAWRRLYAKQIGDVAFGYVFEGTSVTVNAGVTFNSAATLAINCTATIQEINNTTGIKHKQGPLVKTVFISIGAWNMAATEAAWVDVSHILTTNTVYPISLHAFIFGDQAYRGTGAAYPTIGGLVMPSVDKPLYLDSATRALGVCYYKISTGSFYDAPTVPSICLIRNTAFDGDVYNDAAINRGFIRMEYIET